MDHPLRPRRCARGIEDDCRCIGINIGQRLAALFERWKFAHHFHAIHEPCQCRLGEAEARSRVFQNKIDFGGFQARIDGYYNHSGAQDAHHQYNVLDGIVPVHCHAFAALKAPANEMAGHTVHDEIQLAVRNYSFIRDDGSFRRLTMCVFDQKVVEQHDAILRMNAGEDQK